MSKKLTDYLHYYLGCEVQVTTSERVFTGTMIGLYMDHWRSAAVWGTAELSVQVQIPRADVPMSCTHTESRMRSANGGSSPLRISNNAETGEAVMIMSNYTNLPSLFHPSDEGVKLAIPGQPELLHGKVTKVHFTEAPKVLYDLEFKFGEGDKWHRTRLHNVDSAFVVDMFWEPSLLEDGKVDPRYQKNERGRWELKEQ